MPTTYKKKFVEMSEEELMGLTREEVTLGLNDKQIRWCEEYVKNFNCKIAAKKAGYKSGSVATIGWKLRQRDDINLYLAWLKLRITAKVGVRPEDIIDQYARVAFADITDFVQIKNGRATLRDEDEIDGQLVKSVKKGRDGISIELHDKMQALARLERFFEEMPKDWRQKIEERKVSILEERLQLDKIKAGISDDEIEDDGFIDALNAISEDVWEDE